MSAFPPLPKPDPRFERQEIEYLDHEGNRRKGDRLLYYGHIPYAIILTFDACYFTREGLPSIYTSRHKAIIRHFTQEDYAEDQSVQHTSA